MEKAVLNVYRRGRPTEISYLKEEGNDKYGLIDVPIQMCVDGITYTVYQIIALKTFGDVRIGQLGGYVSSFANLSKNDDCWLIGDKAIAVGTTEVRDQSLLENVSCVDSTFTGECDISGNIGESYISKSNIADSTIYGEIKIAKSRVYNSELEGSKLCKILMSEIHNVKSEDDIGVIEFIKSKIDNIICCGEISSINVKFEICPDDPATIDDYIYIDGNDWDAGSSEITINIYRTLFKNKHFSWEQLLEFVGGNGKQPAKKEKIISDVTAISASEKVAEDGVSEIKLEGQQEEDIERKSERKKARSSIEELLGSLAGK